MRPLLNLLLAAALPSAFAAEPISLFDGKSLTGWTPLAEGHVVAKDGKILILSHGKNLWLLHVREFTDFELTVECLMPYFPNCSMENAIRSSASSSGYSSCRSRNFFSRGYNPAPFAI